MPVRGDAPFLFHAIKSLSESTLKPSEILIIDDGISENQLIELKNWNFDLNLKVIKNKGVGLVSALNTGLDLADNELIARLDSDDMVYKNRLELQYDFLRISPEVMVVGSQVTYIDQDNKILGKSVYPPGSINNDKRFNNSCLIAHPSVMYRKNAISKVGGYREVAKIGSTSLCEDFDLWKRIATQGELVNMTDELTFYRQHPAQLSKKFRYAQELATLFVESEAFDKSSIKFEILGLGYINLEDQIKKSISSLPKKQKYKFFIYSKLIRNDTRFKTVKVKLGIFSIRLTNFVKK
jgi:glycosyltransferase involved in cell wall biosynthesis